MSSRGSDEKDEVERESQGQAENDEVEREAREMKMVELMSGDGCCMLHSGNEGACDAGVAGVRRVDSFKKEGKEVAKALRKQLVARGRRYVDSLKWDPTALAVAHLDCAAQMMDDGEFTQVDPDNETPETFFKRFFEFTAAPGKYLTDFFITRMAEEFGRPVVVWQRFATGFRTVRDMRFDPPFAKMKEQPDRDGNINSFCAEPAKKEGCIHLVREGAHYNVLKTVPVQWRVAQPVNPADVNVLAYNPQAEKDKNAAKAAANAHLKLTQKLKALGRKSDGSLVVPGGPKPRASTASDKPEPPAVKRGAQKKGRKSTGVRKSMQSRRSCTFVTAKLKPRSEIEIVEDK